VDVTYNAFGGRYTIRTFIDLSILKLVGENTISRYNCTTYSWQNVTFSDVILVKCVISLWQEFWSEQINVQCIYDYTFAKSYPFSEWGTKIYCQEDPIRYIDCNFNQVALPFLFFGCDWRTGNTFDCNLFTNNCLNWNGSDITLLSL